MLLCCLNFKQELYVAKLQVNIHINDKIHNHNL